MGYIIKLVSDDVAEGCLSFDLRLQVSVNVLMDLPSALPDTSLLTISPGRLLD